MASKFTISTVFAAIDQMTGPVTKMGSSVDALGKKVSNTSGMQKLGNATKAVGVGLMSVATLALAAGTAAASFAKKMADSADSINDTANALGLSNKTLQEYRYIAKLSGMETADMDAALTKLTINVGKGGDAVDDALKKLGLSVEQVKNANPDQMLELIADGMKGVQSSTDKAAITVALFGKSSVKMVNALSGGSEQIKNLREEAQKTGYVMDDMSVKAGAGLGDAIDKLSLTLDGAVNRIGGRFLPFIEKFTVGLQQALEPGGFLSDIMEGLGDVLADVLPLLKPVLDIVGDLIKGVAPLIGSLAKSFAPIMQKIGESVGRMMPSIIRIVDAIVKVLTPALDILMPILDLLLPVLEMVIGYIADFAGLIGGALGEYMKFVKNIIDGIIDVINMAIDGLNSLGASIPRIKKTSAPVPVTNSMAKQNATGAQYRAGIDVNFNNAPAGTTVKSTSKSPNLNLNLGMQGGK